MMNENQIKTILIQFKQSLRSSKLEPTAERAINKSQIYGHESWQ